MALPWLRLLDAVIGMATVARRVRRSLTELSAGERPRALAATEGPDGPLEMRLAGVMVSALKEAFGRDTERLRVERERDAADRARADRLLRLELARQAGEREATRLQTIAAVAAAGWLGTWIVAAGVASRGPGGVAARLLLALAWTLLLGALGSSLSGHARVARAIGAGEDPTDETSPHWAGGAAFWLLLSGLAVSSVAVLLA